MYGAFPLMWQAAMHIYCSEQKIVFTEENNSTPKVLVWDANMATFLLFGDTNMAMVMSCENTL